MLNIAFSIKPSLSVHEIFKIKFLYKIATRNIMTTSSSTNRHLTFYKYTHDAFPFHLICKYTDRQMFRYFDSSLLPIKVSLAGDECTQWMQSVAQMKSINLWGSDEPY
jgi:hypothetical protein